MTSTGKKILIIEDEPLIARDLKRICTKLGYVVAGIAYHSDQALDMLSCRKYDLVLLDISLSGSLSGIDIGKLIHENRKVPFIYVTSFADRTTLSLAKANFPSGYVVKPFEEKDIFTSIEVALVNNSQLSKPDRSRDSLCQKLNVHLTEREYEIIEDIIKGASNSMVAAKYFVSENTVKSHIKNIYRKLGCHGRAELTRLVLE